MEKLFISLLVSQFPGDNQEANATAEAKAQPLEEEKLEEEELD